MVMCNEPLGLRRHSWGQVFIRISITMVGLVRHPGDQIIRLLVQGKRNLLAFNNGPIPRWKSDSYEGKKNPQRLSQSIVAAYLGKQCEEDIYMQVNSFLSFPASASQDKQRETDGIKFGHSVKDNSHGAAA